VWACPGHPPPLHTFADASILCYDTVAVEDSAVATNPDLSREATLPDIHLILGFTVTSATLPEGLPR
jgi:hypothetical protein